MNNKSRIATLEAQENYFTLQQAAHKARAKTDAVLLVAVQRELNNLRGIGELVTLIHPSGTGSVKLKVFANADEIIRVEVVNGSLLDLMVIVGCQRLITLGSPRTALLELIEEEQRRKRGGNDANVEFVVELKQ